MAGKLVVEEGDLKGLSLALDEGETWAIGRDPGESQFVIEDPLVSRKHLLIRRTPDGISIQNLSETNPALLNDEEIGEETLLQNGDAIKVGNELLRYYEDASAHLFVDDSVLDQDAEDADEEMEIPSQSKAEEGDLPETESEIEEQPEEEKPPFPETEEPVESEPGLEEVESGEDEQLEEQEVSAPEEETSIDDIMKTTDELLKSSTPEEPLEQAAPVENAEPGEETEEEIPGRETIFEEEEAPDLGPLAEIDFGLVETGRWLLKVIGGPNVGAEFYMQAGNSYTLGTDPQSCDIVFHDTSVSRQHAKVIVTPEDELMVEDLKSRNGVLINGVMIEGRQPLAPSTIVTLGTTSFVIYDREGEMQTIISPLLPSIVKVLQQESGKPKKKTPEGEAPEEESSEEQLTTEEEMPAPPPAPRKSSGSYIIFTAIIALFVLAGVGTTALFKSEQVVTQTYENTDELIQQALKPYPAIRYTFNPSTGGLLLLGHVSTLADKNQLLYKLQSMPFIKNIDDSGIIIDEYVWQEANSILSKFPEWKGITIYSPEAGEFVLSGYLETRQQAEKLASYLSLNFRYLDLLTKHVVVEEDVLNKVNVLLRENQLKDVAADMNKGEIILTGAIQVEQTDELANLVKQIKQIPGVRQVNNQVRSQTAETGIINISDAYRVSGKSRIGDKYTVVINGRILSENDDLDGMTITSITPNRISLEKDGEKYRIDY